MAYIRLSIVLVSGARIGPGKIALLENVHDTGSISAAARAMDIGYKRAWALIDSLNRAFDQSLVERSTGGAGGGGATLTPFGADVLERYRRIEQAVAEIGTADLELIERHERPKEGPEV